jgi:hypothetical protein
VPNDTSANVNVKDETGFDRMAKQFDIDFAAIGEQLFERTLRVG